MKRKASCSRQMGTGAFKTSVHSSLFSIMKTQIPARLAGRVANREASEREAVWSRRLGHMR
jgi:hypothetical protein